MVGWNSSWWKYKKQLRKFKNINFFSQNQQKVFLEILKDDILQLNFHTFIGSWAQFKELHGPFVNLGVYLPPKHNSPFFNF